MHNLAEARLGNLVERLRRSGCRMTPQRLAVLRVLAFSEDHPSVETIFGRVRDTYPMVSLATIYNTLDTLKAMGEVLEIEFSAGNRYDARQVVPHPHLVCACCGRVEDVALPDVQTQVALAIRRLPYAAVVPHLTFRGICPACQQAEELKG